MRLVDCASVRAAALLAAAVLLFLLDVTLKRVGFSRDYHDAR